MTKVSFIVPTLNRGQYIVRAVASCLKAGEAVQNIETEVIVLDSQSDDGSWELLQDRFHADPRVKLVQNQRGLGPTHSWIDGVHCATGDYMTFVWSDDYVSPRFLSRLLPLMNDETHVAIGAAIMRNVDEDSPFPTDDTSFVASASDYLAGFFPPFAGKTPNTVSPACALFSKACFERWTVAAQNWGRATPLREQVIWKRAIGPDLMLYFMAALAGEKIAYTPETVAQFSAHPGSISISVSKYLLRAGYWLARSWLVKDAGLTHEKSHGRLLRLSAETLWMGWLLKRRFPADAIKLDKAEARRLISEELSSIWHNMRAHNSLPDCLIAIACSVFWRAIPRRYRRAAT